MTDIDFRKTVLDLFPKLKVLAMAKTRNGAAAEDIVQDVMVRVWSDPEGILAAVDRLETTLEQYLKRMVLNRFIDVVRRDRRLVHDDDFAERLIEVVPSDPTRRNLLLRDLARHLARIGGDCASLLIERASGVKQQDLAASRAMTQSGVNKRIARCLRELNDSCGGVFSGP